MNPESTESTQNIILALLEDGLASPGTAAWAMEHLTRTPQAYRAACFHYVAYGTNCHTLWNQRNQALAMWRHTRNPPMSDAQYSGDLDQGTSVGPQPTAAPPPPPTQSHLEQAAATSLPEGIAGSEALTPKSAHPCSLPSTAGWALPVSSSTAKYVDLAKRPKAKQTRSASASGTGEPLEGLLDTLRQGPKVTRKTTGKN